MERGCQRKLIELIKLFSKVYCCTIIGFCVMGNHYHLIVHFEEPRTLSRKELRKRASLIYSAETLDKWLEDKWIRFEKRVFDLSELMRSVQSSFARWYNRRNDRRGRFWADRFKSTLLETSRHVRECLMYIDLNPVRAGLVQRPEDWAGSSIYYRTIRQDGWMIGLKELIGARSRKHAMGEYRARLYYRGALPSRAGDSKITERIIKREESRGFEGGGIYKKQLRYFAEGVAIGTEDFIEHQILRLRELCLYSRRKNPIKPREAGGARSVVAVFLREQRSTAF